MARLAIKNLFHERTRLIVSVGGVAAALFMVLLLEGVFAGATEQLVAYIEESDADVWVMQEGVSNMHMATSMLPARLEETIGGVPGVQAATPILYSSNLVQAGERSWFSYVVGLRPGSERGGPWAMKEGVPFPGPGEAVISDVLARKSGVVLGSAIAILDRRLRVVGLSEGTFSMANSVTFISYSDMEELLSAPGAASYFLVKTLPGVPPATLAESIEQAAPGVNAMTKGEFADGDRARAMEMGVTVIRVMSLIGFAVGVLVIGLTVYTATVRRAREYGIAKALGARSRQLLAVVAFQTLVIALLGLGIAAAVAYLTRPLLGAAVPEVSLQYQAGSLARLSVISAGIAALASLLPAYRIARVEPAVAFKE